MASSHSEETFERARAEQGTRVGSGTGVLEWVLVEADRLVLVGWFSVATFVGLLSLGDLGVIAFVNDDSITRLAGGMVAGSFSLVTLVVSINQLILSREFTSAGEAEDKLDSVLSFREEIAATAFIPASPRSPARQFELLVAALDDRAETLASTVDGRTDEAGTQVARYANTVCERTERIEDAADWTASGTFESLRATVNYDDDWQLHAARHLRGRYGESLQPDTIDALDDLIETLRLLGVAREHVKTTYLQRELTRFSQLTIAIGIPAIVAALLLGFVFAAPVGNAIPAHYLPYVVSAHVTVVVSPVGLLASYILRTATLARRTASVGPMDPQTSPGEGPFDVQYGEAKDPELSKDGCNVGAKLELAGTWFKWRPSDHTPPVSDRLPRRTVPAVRGRRRC